jgi:hypothetical protein
MTPAKDAFPEPCPPPPTVLQPSVLLPSASLPLSPPQAAGIDIGAAEHWGAVPPDRSPPPVRRCGTGTAALEALADWLLDCGVTTVAMESPGVSWRPLFELLEARGLQVMLIDPRQAQRAPGRPTTDRLACQWLPRLPASGLLAAACHPTEQGCGLRSALRPRQRLLPSAAPPRHPLHKAWQQLHRKLSQGLRDLTSVTGMASLRALIAGARAPRTRAKRRNPHCHQREDESANALHGPWRAAPLFALQPAVALSHCDHQQLTVCDQRRQAHLPVRITGRASLSPPHPAAIKKPMHRAVMPARPSLAWRGAP